MKKISEFLFQFLVVKFSVYLNRRVFIMLNMYTSIAANGVRQTKIINIITNSIDSE